MKINKEELHNIFDGIYHGEELKFNELYTKYYNIVYSVAFSILKNKENAEDISQTIFTKIYGLPKQQLPTKYEASWLYTITKNEALNYIRKHKNIINIDAAYYVTEENSIEKIISKDAYNRIMSKLNEKEREIVSLKLVSNLPFREIAKLLNMPIGTVQWKYYKSLNTLKLLLTNLSIFIITISLFIVEKVKKGNNKNEEIQEIENEREGTENIKTNDIVQLPSEDTKGETLKERENIVEQEIVEEIKENEEVNNVQASNLEVWYLSISGIFLFFTIIFTVIFIKHNKCKK